jgi:hypothetical protein
VVGLSTTTSTWRPGTQMGSWPSKLKLFKKWAKAMEEGAKMDTPDYGKQLKVGRTLTSRPLRSARGRRFRRKRRKQD